MQARSAGPVRLASGEPAPPGMVRLTNADTTGVALSVWPDGVTPALLEEYQLPPISVERSGETRRVLAACLKCCWPDLSIDPWPGEPAPAELILDTYRALIGRTDDVMRNWAIGALRRLHDSAWIIMSDGVVRLGPRCATWPTEAHAQLQELVRRIPDAPRTTLTVVDDTAIIAAITSPKDSPDTPATTEVPDVPAMSPASTDIPATTDAPISTDVPASTEDPDAPAAPPATAPISSAPATTHAAEGTPTAPTSLLSAETAASDQGLDGPEASDDSMDGASDHAADDDGATTASSDGAAAASGVKKAAVLSSVGGRVEGGESADFDDLLDPYDERRRAELVAAFMAVEHAAEPVPEARLVALRDPALRHTLSEMLARRGRTLIQHRERWTSGYDDTVAEQTGSALGVAERAVLTLVLVHSVAIPRAEGVLPEDTWLSPHPAPVEELRRHTQLPIGELDAALRALRHAGLLSQVKAGEEAGGYVPGPQFHRLTPTARRRLQEELILAAGPHSPLATAVRARRSAG
ncbi:hypothetical protein ACIBG8_33700 [Nonomuraea sp. NPDC050556]|uniref:hypothetical protein n=1 Tax=Nonomuraea sp. NPDC050556 TaxID=3364369 RepID=UPI0037A03717